MTRRRAHTVAERLFKRRRELRDAVALNEAVLSSAHNAHVGMDEHGVITARE